MPVTVRIPSPLRGFAANKAEVEARGKTVGEVITDLSTRHPELTSRITEGGKLRRYVNFFVNEQDIRALAGAETPVRDGDVLTIMPAIAGGRPAA